MELEQLIPKQVGPRVFALVDRSSRRITKRFERVADVIDLEVTARKMQTEKEFGDIFLARYGEDRTRLLNGVVTRLVKRGIYGFRFESSHQPFIVWWYRKSTWKVTDIWKLVRSRSFRRSTAGRASVTFSWTGDVLGEAELKKIRDVLGSDFIRRGKFSIKKTGYQSASGIKRPPIGTTVGSDSITVELIPEWQAAEKPSEPSPPSP